MPRRKRKPKFERKVEGSYELSDEAKERRDFSEVFDWVDPANTEMCSPRESSMIPEGGAWAMITRQLPPMEHSMNEMVRVGRIFWVEQHEESDDKGFLFNGSYKVYCKTEWGDVWLWPYEYSVIDFEAIIRMWNKKEIIFHPTNMELARLNDMVYYIRTRGIALQDAIVFALGSIKGSVGWFEPAPELAEECEAMEERVHRWKPEKGHHMAVTVSEVSR